MLTFSSQLEKVLVEYDRKMSHLFGQLSRQLLAHSDQQSQKSMTTIIPQSSAMSNSNWDGQDKVNETIITNQSYRDPSTYKDSRGRNFSSGQQFASADTTSDQLESRRKTEPKNNAQSMSYAPIDNTITPYPQKKHNSRLSSKSFRADQIKQNSDLNDFK